MAEVLKIRLKPKHASVTIVEDKNPVRYESGQLYEKDADFLVKYGEWFELVAAGGN